jgi:hypothetical protein
MAKVYKPGFFYIKSAILKQEVAMNIKTCLVYCEDGVQYSPQEILLFYEADAEIDLGAHLVKKVFGGEVVKVKRNILGNGQAKQIESGTGNGSPDNSNPSEKIPDVSGNSAESKGGEFDIY